MSVEVYLLPDGDSPLHEELMQVAPYLRKVGDIRYMIKCHTCEFRNKRDKGSVQRCLVTAARCPSNYIFCDHYSIEPHYRKKCGDVNRGGWIIDPHTGKPPLR